MTVRKLLFAVLLSVVSFALYAQESTSMTTTTPTPGAYRSFTPKDKWEIGLEAGIPFIAGDVKSEIGFGGGLHVRKALDHIFSLRISGLYAKTSNLDDGGNTARKSDAEWLSGGAEIVVALNNFRFNKPVRRVLLNGILGAGYTNYKVHYENIPQLDGTVRGDRERTDPYVQFGGGIAFRVSPKFNVGLDYTVYETFGRYADLLDGEENVNRPVTTFRDIMHYPRLSLNFNIGGKNSDGTMKSEPLYWVNPLAQVSDAIVALEARPIYDPTDTDMDGIIDAIDDEDSSPAGAKVDTRGVTLDSDGDKVADYMDKEPYSPPGYSVDPTTGVANVPKPISEADVNRIVDAKIAAIKFPEPKGGDWFLPMVNFGDNRYDLRYSEYEKLYQIASVLKMNPDLKIVVIGAADKRGPEPYNNVLSFNRAQAAIDFLVENHGIARDRLILNWIGETVSIIPVEGSNRLNRRAEFRTAKGETEMARPEGPNAGMTTKKKGSFKGNKDAGY